MADAPPPLRSIPELFTVAFDDAYDLSRGSLEHWFREGVRHVVDTWDIADIARDLETYGSLERWLTQDPEAVAAMDEFRELFDSAYKGPRGESGRREERHRARVVQSFAAGAEASVITSAIPDRWYDLSRWTDEAISWVDREGAARVTRISDSMRGGIRAIVREAYEVKGAGREGIARAIRGLEGKDGVRFGLDERRSRQWAKFMNETLDDVTLSPARKQQLLDRRYNQLLRSRARTIAHTESVTATNAGQDQAYRVAADEGQLDTQLYVLEWVARVNRCPRCAAFDTSTREITGGMFVSDGSGPNGVETIERSPLHVNCWCYLRSIRRSEAKRLPATVEEIAQALRIEPMMIAA